MSMTLDEMRENLKDDKKVVINHPIKDKCSHGVENCILNHNEVDEGPVDEPTDSFWWMMGICGIISFIFGSIWASSSSTLY